MNPSSRRMRCARGSALVVATVIFLFVGIGAVAGALLSVRHRAHKEQELAFLRQQKARYEAMAGSLAAHFQRYAPDQVQQLGVPAGTSPLTEPLGLDFGSEEFADDEAALVWATHKIEEMLQDERATLYPKMTNVDLQQVSPQLADPAQEVAESFLGALVQAPPIWLSIIESQRRRLGVWEDSRRAAETAEREWRRLQQALNQPGALENKQQLVDLHREWIRQQDDRRASGLAQLTQMRDHLRAENADLDRRRRQIEFETGQARTQLQRQISALRADIEQMRSVEAVAYRVRRAAGHVVRTDPMGRIVFLSLGRRDAVAEGMLFRVARPAPGGTFSYKAVVEIRRVEETMSEAEIVRILDPWDPVLAGDPLVNPFFGGRRPPVVALVGRARAPGIPIGGEEVLRQLALYGVTVRAELTTTAEHLEFAPTVVPDIDFAIRMPGYEDRPGYRDILQLEIPLAEPEILRFLTKEMQ